MQKKTIMIVDDERDIVNLLDSALKFSGFDTVTKSNGEEALEYLTTKKVDLILLDIMMPKLSGTEVVKHLRKIKDTTPIILLTAKDEIESEIDGLEIGADDYITKPFSIEAVIARVNSVLRRAKMVEDDRYNPEISWSNIVINLDSHDAYYKDECLDLTETEYKILKYLVINGGIVVTKNQILDYAWDYEYQGDINIVETFISTLRKKLNPNNKEAVIETKRGAGYLIRDTSK